MELPLLKHKIEGLEDRLVMGEDVMFSSYVSNVLAPLSLSLTFFAEYVHFL